MKESPRHKQDLLLDEPQIPVGTALAWPLLDEDGAVLLRAGDVIASEEERSFLLQHFSLYMGAISSAAGASAKHEDDQEALLTSAQMQLQVGAPLGVRSVRTMSAPMRPSRVIGMSPNHALFVTPPGAGRQPLVLTEGENVHVVGVGTHAVFWFVCTVEAVCHHPFAYLVLSEPGAIRRLRERKAMRVRTRLAVRYQADSAPDIREGLGIGRDLSVRGMSLATHRLLGEVGTPVRVAFPINTDEYDVEFNGTAVVRNVKDSRSSYGFVIHGLEFDAISAELRSALRSFMFERLGPSPR